MDISEVLNKNTNIVLSLREEYFSRILAGEKKFEYRKKFLNDSVTALIYVSKTKKEIAGIIEFDKSLVLSSEEIATKADEMGESVFSDMLAYFGERKIGYMIPVKKVYVFEQPISLETLRTIDERFFPPQSYCYLKEDSKLFQYLINSNIKLLEVKI